MMREWLGTRRDCRKHRPRHHWYKTRVWPIRIATRVYTFRPMNKVYIETGEGYTWGYPKFVGTGIII